jgi:hypothetical protein
MDRDHMTGTSGSLGPDDAAVLAAHGLATEEARRQLRLLAGPPAPVRLERPCTPGDGIARLGSERVAALVARHAVDAAAGRITAFVPASGAATRMFQDLLAAAARAGDLAPADLAGQPAAEAAPVRAYVEGLPRFAFLDALSQALAARGLDAMQLRSHGPWRPLLESLLAPEGLDYARQPKGLLAFHRAPDGVRTAFEEHLVEAASVARDRDGTCRLHFTVSPEHRGGFEALLARKGAALAARCAARWEVGFSEQHPSTDTLALGADGNPVRDANGVLLFRPSGHGALLRNLDELGADLVFLKNIDNVAVDRLKGETLRWSAALLGLASELVAHAHALRARLDDPADAAAVADAVRWRREALGDPAPPATRAALADSLDRPVRVCGMVPNTGEPGGGPFWVRGDDGTVTRQVVESAQVAPEPSQQAIARGATHFNPVFIACALRDRAGRPWPLGRFVDESAVIVTRKSAGGRELLALERPGLWNGAMARWTTVFVEVPLAVFNPVKSVLDLLRPEHQG